MLKIDWVETEEYTVFCGWTKTMSKTMKAKKVFVYFCVICGVQVFIKQSDFSRIFFVSIRLLFFVDDRIESIAFDFA